MGETDWGGNWVFQLLMGGATLSKSLIQFSVGGWGCVSSLLFTWGQTMVEVMKIMGTSFKGSHAGTSTFSVPKPAAGHCGPTPLLETPGHSCGVTVPFSWVLVHKVLFVLSKSLFPQSCVSSGRSMVGLMVTSSKRAYAIPRSAAPRAPAPVADYCWPLPPQQTLKHHSVSVSLGSLGPGTHKVCLSPLSISVGYAVWF